MTPNPFMTIIRDGDDKQSKEVNTIIETPFQSLTHQESHASLGPGKYVWTINFAGPPALEEFKNASFSRDIIRADDDTPYILQPLTILDYLFIHPFIVLGIACIIYYIVAYRKKILKLFKKEPERRVGF